MIKSLNTADRVERLYVSLNWRAVQAYERGDTRRGQRLDRFMSKLDRILSEEAR